MTGPRRATAPPLRLRLRSETAARPTISYYTQDRKPDGGWGHFKPSRWGQRKPSLRSPERGGASEPLHLLFRLAHLPFDVPVADAEGRNQTAVTVRLDPEPLRRLAAGDLDAALRVVVRRLEASGLRPVFRRAVATRDLARRLGASLAFPISQEDAARAARLVCKPYTVKDVQDQPAVPA